MSDWTLQHPWMTLLIAYWTIQGMQRSAKKIGRFILDWKRIAKEEVDRADKEKP